jgi:chemotaxis signal transduction protein
MKGTRSRYLQGIAKHGEKVRMILNLFAMLNNNEKTPESAVAEERP